MKFHSAGNKSWIGLNACNKELCRITKFNQRQGGGTRWCKKWSFNFCRLGWASKNEIQQKIKSSSLSVLPA